MAETLHHSGFASLPPSPRISVCGGIGDGCITPIGGLDTDLSDQTSIRVVEWVFVRVWWVLLRRFGWTDRQTQTTTTSLV